MIKYDIDYLPPNEYSQIMSVFEYVVYPSKRMNMMNLRHDRDLRFIVNVRNAYFNTERTQPVMLSKRHREWLDLIYRRVVRGYYDYMNIEFQFDPPKDLLEKFSDIISPDHIPTEKAIRVVDNVIYADFGKRA